MRVWIALICLALGFALTARAESRWPKTPHPELTPGSLCARPDQLRYPERIPYCSRSVRPEAKDEVVRIYDRRLGTRIEQMGRRDFKIDHFIPLCMGGSNELDNLWPQHPSIYVMTDPIEEQLCIRLREGRMKQSDAVRIIRLAKTRHDLIPSIQDQLRQE